MIKSVKMLHSIVLKKLNKLMPVDLFKTNSNKLTMTSFTFKGNTITKDDLDNTNILTTICNTYLYGEHYNYSDDDYKFLEYIVQNDYLLITETTNNNINTFIFIASLFQYHVRHVSTLFEILKHKNFNIEKFTSCMIYRNYAKYDFNVTVYLLDTYPEIKVYSEAMIRGLPFDNQIIVIKKLIEHEYQFTDIDLANIVEHFNNSLKIDSDISMIKLINMLRNTYFKFTFAHIKTLIQNSIINIKFNILYEIIQEYNIVPDTYFLINTAIRRCDTDMLDFALQYDTSNIKHTNNKDLEFYNHIKKHNLEDIILKTSLFKQ